MIIYLIYERYSNYIGDIARICICALDFLSNNNCRIVRFIRLVDRVRIIRPRLKTIPF